MKNVLILLVCLFISARVCAQVSNPGDVVKSGATDHVNNDVSNTVDNGLNKTEDAIKGLFKKKKKPAKTDTTAAVKPVQQQHAQPQQQPNGGSNTSANDGGSGNIKVYQNFDFVAGDKIVFSDDFQADQDAEFPAHWVLKKGQGLMNTQAGKKSMVLTDGNYVEVSPRMANTSYLGKEFTVEFDTYMANTSEYPIMVFFLLPGTTDDSDASLTFNRTDIGYDNSIQDSMESFSANLPAAIADDNYLAKWHHISIGYKNNQLKVYVDQYRVLSVPDAKIVPGSIKFGGLASQDAPIIFTNVKVAQGGSQNMIGNILTDGKFITHGITFDIDKATIKPESMGVLNQVANFLKSNTSIKMEIDGHTDNTGNSAHNMQLSQQRADAVKTQLVSMGIDASRFTTRGLGDTKPIDNNTTPEGKASNRRVEFIKI